MSMSRRDFETIARTINRAILRAARDHNGAAVLALDALAKDMATEIAMTNGRFDTTRFLLACGVDEE